MIFSLLFGGEEPGLVAVISNLEHVGHWAVTASGKGPVAPELSPSSLPLGLPGAGPRQSLPLLGMLEPCYPPLSSFGFVSPCSVNAFDGALPTWSEVLLMHRQRGCGQDGLERARSNIIR